MKYKRLTVIILAIVIICLVATGIIVSKLMKQSDGLSETEDKYWFFQQSEETGQPVYLQNVYIVSNEKNTLRFLYDYTIYEVKGVLKQEFTGIADIQIEGEKITKVRVKPDLQTGVLESYSENEITLKNISDFPRNGEVPIYRITEEEVEQTEWNQLIIGVSNIQCVMEKGVVCGILITEDTVPTDVRVVIKNGSSIYHSDICIKKASDSSIIHAKSYLADNKTNFFLVEDEEGLFLCDSEGNPITDAYEGSFRIIKDEDGLVLVNELSVETYVKYVLPSEMLRSFGEEALKAQAVCARTYAYAHMKNQTYAKYGANLDDSTNFQAYHNIGRYPETDAAVDATAGEVITCNGELISCYYYSTSPGVTNDMSSWENDNNKDYIACMGMEFSNGYDLTDAADFSQFMIEANDCYDSASSFFRWKAVLDISSIKETEKGILKKISVKKRNQAGYITELELTYENEKVTLKNENDIRKVLGYYLEEVVLQNEQVRTDLSMIPSACFEVLDINEEQILLRGGGFGHGIGMSQYGANAMAEEGFTYNEIIDYYYENVVVKKIG